VGGALPRRNGCAAREEQLRGIIAAKRNARA